MSRLQGIDFDKMKARTENSKDQAPKSKETSNSKLKGVVRGAWCVLLLCASAQAQSYSIDWFKIAGGGGSSSNGQYAVSGTIGQPDAGHMSGGTYTLDGGFWGIIATVQTEGSPPLTIILSSPSTVTVSWPSPSTGFALQENLTLNPGSWSTVPPTNTDNGTIKSIVVPGGPGNKFYRLKK